MKIFGKKPRVETFDVEESDGTVTEYARLNGIKDFISLRAHHHALAARERVFVAMREREEARQAEVTRSEVVDMIKTALSGEYPRNMDEVLAEARGVIEDLDVSHAIKSRLNRKFREFILGASRTAKIVNVMIPRPLDEVRIDLPPREVGELSEGDELTPEEADRMLARGEIWIPDRRPTDPQG